MLSAIRTGTCSRGCILSTSRHSSIYSHNISSGSSIIWSRRPSAPVDHLTRCRLLSTLPTSSSQAADSQIIQDTSSPPVPPTEAFQTSSHEIWAADAAKLLSENETFTDLGLGGYSPIGLLQSSMEFFNSSLGLPWWGAIVASTLCLRVLFIPLNIYIRKNAVRLNNINPEVEKFKDKMNLYLTVGKTELANLERRKMNAVFKKHGARPILSVIPMLFQGGIFLSFFVAIRRMVNAPVVGMMNGGALWFTDLTVPDPAYVLPIISTASLLVSLELGGEAGVKNPQMEKTKKYFRIAAIGMIAVTSRLPAGLFMYWLPSLAFSICNVLVLKLPGIRGLLGIDDEINVQGNPQDKRLTWSETRKLRQRVEEKKKELKKEQARYEQLRNDRNPKLFAQKPPPKEK